VRALTPKRIVEELNKYIVGQDQAKRMVAIAVRNRWRRQQLAADMREEVLPKNILMIGPTGVGKTEIARRLAQLVKAPFVKVEASKYTEVGYVGRDVETIIRDLVEIGVGMRKAELRREVEAQARERAERRLADLLVKKGWSSAAALEAVRSGGGRGGNRTGGPATGPALHELPPGRHGTARRRHAADARPVHAQEHGAENRDRRRGAACNRDRGGRQAHR